MKIKLRYIVIFIVIILSLLLCLANNHKNKKENLEENRYVEKNLSRIRYDFLDEEYRYDEYNEDIRLLLCLSASCVDGKVVYDKVDKKIVINDSIVYEPAVKMWYTLYNKYLTKDKIDKKMYFEELYKIIGKSKQDKIYLEEIKKSLKDSFFEKLKAYQTWEINLSTRGNSDGYHLLTSDIWENGVANASEIDPTEYDIEKFTQEDWEIICKHYVIKPRCVIDDNYSSPLGKDEIKALEHAKNRKGRWYEIYLIIYMYNYYVVMC